jgi:transposase-like protein
MTPQGLSFVPPHCPRSDCRFHTCADGWRWVRYGFFTRHCSPQRIQRFRCRHCGATFSSQSFSTTYYLKRPELLPALFYRLLSCAGYRQMAREARCAASTLIGQAARLGRHALLYLATHRPPAPSEPLVIDGFESFAYSRYHPLHLNLAVGAHSHYVDAFTQATLRRKGRMTAGQKKRRLALEREHGRPDPKALEHAMVDLIRIAAPAPQALTLRSDEHPAYPRALRRLTGYHVQHECTPSVQARTPGNPLFPVNLMDTQLRHNSANHKRETIAYSKRHQAVIERGALLILWRNFTKPFSENHDGGTPAMRVGLRATPLSPEWLLKGRLFFSRVRMPESWRGYYRRRVPTVGIPRPRRHESRLAF